MKPIILACAAMVFYASQNVVVEQKLARYNTLSVLVYFYLTMLPLALVGLGYLKATAILLKMKEKASKYRFFPVITL